MRQKSPLLPPIKDLIEGRVYYVRARNFRYAIYTGKGEFLGIRYKFGDRFLDTEDHWDIDGTIGYVKDLGIDAPGNVDLFKFLDAIAEQRNPQEDSRQAQLEIDAAWRELEKKMEEDIENHPNICLGED